jgi:uncharacterized protein (TIGR02145 family)
MKRIKCFFAAIGMMLTIAFHFSCTSLEDGDTFQGCAKGDCKKTLEVSSSSEEVSSSSSSSSSSLSEGMIRMCGDVVFNPKTHFCQGDAMIKLLCGEVPYEATQFCQSPNVVKDFCGEVPYEATQFCQSSNVVRKLCGEVPYEATQFCQSPNNVVQDFCGTVTYTSSQFCQSPNVVKNLCGGKPYLETELCIDNVAVTDLCGTIWYNSSTHFCQNGTITLLCGDKPWTIDQFCQIGSNVVQNLCGSNTFATNERCGTGNVIEPAYCGGEEYAITEYCCAEVKYAFATHFCYANTIYSKCNGSNYNPSTQFCNSNTIYSKCNGSDYNLSTHFCISNTLYSKCGGSDYDPLHGQECCGSSIYSRYNQFCQSPNVVKNLCGKVSYPATQFCDSYAGSNTLYKKVTIGTQTWMAENLNLKISNSRCYNDDEICNKYGRLYRWDTALGVNCEPTNQSCAGRITDQHQGICPSGWHIPRLDEWETLFSFVGEVKHLMSTDGWPSSIGDDIYGFKALPGGVFLLSFRNIGEEGLWHNTSNISRAGFCHDGNDIKGINSNGERFTACNGGDVEASVRCVENY